MSDHRLSAPDPHSKKRIALICDSLEDEFQSALVDAGLAAAHAYDVDLIIVPGGKLGEPNAKAFIYDLLSPLWADGIIVAANTIGHVASQREMATFLDDLRPTPTVSLAEVPGADCCLVVDNETAVYELTQHLVQQHRHTRFVFVSGPANNVEAHARERGFCRALEEEQLALPEEQRIVEDFTLDGGRRAIRELLDSRGIDIDEVDALVCANDAMAVGACQELELRSVCVPRDLAVVGFDDTGLARHLPAPLTTVRQPIRNQLFDAVQLLSRRIEDDAPLRGQYRYDAELIVRRSCGCPRLPNLQHPSSPWRASIHLADAIQAMLPAMRDELDAGFVAALDEVSLTWLEELTEALTTQLEEQGTAFFDTLEILSFGLLRDGKSTTGWQQTLLVLRRFVSRGGLSDSEMLSELDHMVDGAIRLTSELATSYIVRQRDELLEHLRVLSGATAGLLAAPDLTTITEVTRDFFPKLGVERGLIYLFGSEPSAEAMMNPISVFGLGADTDPAPVSAMRLGSDESLRGRNWVIEPLGTALQPLGLAVLECGLAQASWYERLRDALTAAIKAARLSQEVQFLVITDPLTGLRNRRYLTERIRQELDAERGANLPVSLLVLDLDGFKSLNDQRGHDAGDLALVEAAQAFKDCLRDTDTLARFGGDEFVAVLPGTNEEKAQAVARRMLSSLPPHLLAKTTVKLTCSIGIATTDGSTGDAELFRLADQALLAAKRQGKNCAVHARELVA